MNLLDKLILERIDSKRPLRRPVNERLGRSKKCALFLYLTASVREFYVSAFNHPFKDSAPSSLFQKVAFWRPSIVKWSPFILQIGILFADGQVTWIQSIYCFGMNKLVIYWNNNNYYNNYYNFPALEINEEASQKVMTAAQGSTTGHPTAEGLVPASGASVDRAMSILASPNEWSHGAHWYRSSAVLLRYHK